MARVVQHGQRVEVGGAAAVQAGGGGRLEEVALHLHAFVKQGEALSVGQYDDRRHRSRATRGVGSGVSDG